MSRKQKISIKYKNVVKKIIILGMKLIEILIAPGLAEHIITQAIMIAIYALALITVIFFSFFSFM